ncbi:DUF397 domain-containing protein [Streptomyces sp. NPDC048340]|uniref:DUF397 domain-containing protein n=1 Tax=Streptomyces sp. NPDC048340 TaxID=3365537 RepID=UPI003717FD6A
MRLPTHPQWRKSSYSNGTGGECVEVVRTLECIGVRDSKRPHGPVLLFHPHTWTAFVDRTAQQE